MANHKYLDKLINEVNNLREKIDFCEIDTSSCSFSYMLKKKTSFVGYKQGYFENLIQEQNGMKESNDLRATAKDYLKYIKNKDNDVLQIESYVKGKLDCLFQVHWIEGKRYLFPFAAKGWRYPTYVYVTCYDGNTISEEYMVNGNQIVYEAYSRITDTEVTYHMTNYVSGGKYPVLETREGMLQLNPLSYKETAYDNWMNH